MPLLVPVDFSPPSEAALRLACRLASAMKTTPLVLHVVHDPGDMPGYYEKALKKKPMIGHIEDAAAQMLATFLAEAARRHGDVERCNGMASLLVRGLPTTRIIEVARKRDVTMIIMGSRGRTGLKHLMTGSVAEQVMRLAPVPVTVVKS